MIAFIPGAASFDKTRKGFDMYELTLTADERGAFDWVGERYNAGKVANILREHMPEDEEWSGNDEITFLIPESAAWEMRDLFEEEGYTFPCFSRDLTEKLVSFLEEIV